MGGSRVKRFFGYVEIMTKITSVFAFGMALAYLFYLKQAVNVKLTIVFFLSMFLFDLTATAINNYIDTKTNTQQLQFNRRTALAIIYILLFFSGALGLYLAYLTDLVVLMAGGLCFLCGILYTYGPVPLSRQPLGELFSGVFYGFFIPFLLLYINMPKGTYLNYSLTMEAATVTVSFLPFIKLFFLCVAPVCATAGIMLANNICDVEKDIQVRRYTLPYYLGNRALALFAFLYYAIYAGAVLMVLFQMVPPLFLLLLFTLIPVEKNINIFRKEQKKETTFLCSIKNFVIIMGTDIVLLLICGIIR